MGIISYHYEISKQISQRPISRLEESD